MNKYAIIIALSFLIPGFISVIKGYTGYHSANCRSEEIKAIRYSIAGAACCTVSVTISGVSLFIKFLQ